MEGLIALKDSRQDFPASLNQSFCPARLLGLECGHFNRQFGGALNVLQVYEFPSFELGAVGKVRIFGQRVVLPSTGFFDGAAPPYTGSSVEIEKHIAASAS